MPRVQCPDERLAPSAVALTWGWKRAIAGSSLICQSA